MDLVRQFINQLACQFLPDLSRKLGIGYKVETNITAHNFEVEDGTDGKKTLLAPNENRVDYRVYNESDNSIYIAESSNEAGPEHYTTQLGANSEEDSSASGGLRPYTGEVTFNPSVEAEGRVQVTEYVLVEDRS